MPGSPFRDELASAHEKIQQLEMVNEALRARLGRAPLPPPRPRPSIFIPLTTAWAIMMTAAVVRVSAQPATVVRMTTAAPVLRIPPPPPARARTPAPCVQSPGDSPFCNPALGI